MHKTQVCFQGQKDTLKEEMATHPGVFAWEIPWTEEPGGLHSPWGPKQSDTTKHARWVLLNSPTMHRTDPITQNNLAPKDQQCQG